MIKRSTVTKNKIIKVIIFTIILFAVDWMLSNGARTEILKYILKDLLLAIITVTLTSYTDKKYGAKLV
jgi:uncharacterized protein with ParB-like and HNH nuclease domain